MEFHFSTLIDICYRFPESICLFSADELLFLSENRKYIDDKTVDNLDAEILFRNWLYQDNSFPSISNYAQKHFEELVLFFSHINSLSDFDSSSDSSLVNIEKLVHARIKKHLRSDGIIPVVRSGIAFPLSFSLLKSADNKAAVIDANNIEHTEWTKSLNAIPSDLFKPWTVKLECSLLEQRDQPDNCEFYPIGNSFHLPVFLAILNRLGIISFQTREIIATGSLEKGILSRVDGIKPKAKMAKEAGAKLFIAPKQSEKVPGICELSLNASINDIQAEFPRILDEKGHSILDWRDCKDQIKKLDTDVHYGIVPLQKSALPRIERYEMVFRENGKDPELLDALMLKSLVFCETGRTAESIKLNSECRYLAEKNKSFYKYYRLAIEFIVNLTDIGDFHSAQYYILENLKIEEMKVKVQEDNNIHDLLMRLQGTLGQLYLYGVLAGTFEDDLMNESIECLQNSVKIAETHADKRYELCKDVNYVHLWYAINEFDSDKESQAYRNSLNAIARLDSEDERQKNRAYLYRQKWYGAYRHFLLTGHIPDYEGYGMPDERNAEGWTLSMVLKYKATFLAARNNLDEARELFERSISILDKPGNPLLNLLGTTSSVQAWESLKASKHKKYAIQCKNRAQNFFSRKDILEHYKFALDWRHYISGENKSNPQLKYQY